MMIGIDLGTTNSLVAYFDGEAAKIIPNRLGSHLTPSVVSVDENGTVYVGQTAKESGQVYPLDTASVFKRSMGTPKEYVLAGRKFTAEELSSFVLRSLKEDAEQALGEVVSEAIISVPAYFNDIQRKATKHAGELAGRTVERIINEPTAAAIAHGLYQDSDLTRFLVFDLGGGTFDVSILELSDNIMEVHAIAGDNFMGGEDFTNVICERFFRVRSIDPDRLDYKTLAQIRAQAELCKCALSTALEAEMVCNINGEEIRFTLSLSAYEKACEPLFEQLRKPIERSLKDAGMRLSDIDEIVMVGGATKAPVVRKFVAKLFGRIPNTRINPDEAIAIGAALQCGMKARDKAIREMILTDVCPFTLGTEISQWNGVFKEGGHYMPIIERNTVIPVSRTETFYTATDYQTQIRVEILQGESRLARNNIRLGEIVVPVPAHKEGEESVDVTYTYDINALLEVEVLVNATGYRKKIIIQQDESKITPAQAEARMAELQYLKINPRDEEENKLALFRAERMYEETVGNLRLRIDRLTTDFEAVLKRQDKSEIKTAREALMEALNQIERESGMLY